MRLNFLGWKNYHFKPDRKNNRISCNIGIKEGICEMQDFSAKLHKQLQFLIVICQRASEASEAGELVFS